MSAPSVKPSKDDQVVMCVKASTLFGDQEYFHGFSPASAGCGFYSEILQSFEWKRRGDVEHDRYYKQVIPYIAIVHPEKGIWTYQRAVRHDEDRLSGKWAFGIGGHIDKSDEKGVGVQGARNIVEAGRNREMREEVQQPGKTPVPIEKYDFLGFLNYDDSMAEQGYGFDEKEVAVGRVHFGVLIAAQTNAPEIIGRDLEIAQGGFKSAIELEGMLKEEGVVVEPWSRLAMPVATGYLNCPF